MAISFKNLVEQYKFDEDKVLKTLKSAQIVDSKDTVSGVREREFSEEAIQNGFNVILDYFKASIVPQDDFKKAEELFRKHQSEKGKVGKQAAVADAKSQAAPAQETGAITASGDRSLSALVGQDGAIAAQILTEGETAELLKQYAKSKAVEGADQISEAPFDGVSEAAAAVDPGVLRQYGASLYIKELNDELNDPQRVQALRDKYLGKK
jgi:hypothetical protein